MSAKVAECSVEDEDGRVQTQRALSGLHGDGQGGDGDRMTVELVFVQTSTWTLE